MRYLALASDYDGTIARSKRMTQRGIAALERLRLSGRRSLLVTGRVHEHLARDCPNLDVFDALVLENGAVLYFPKSRETVALGPSPSQQLIDRLRERGVPVATGRVIIATSRPHELAVLEAIRDLGLELHIIFNEDAVMVLPAGLNKGTGLASALRKMGLSPHEVVAVGNAENDHSFLDLCECSVAVANAVQSIKSKVDFTTRGECDEGVAELVDELIATDLANRMTSGPGDVLTLAMLDDGSALTFRPYGQNLLITGPSGAGKSTFATGLIERLIARSYQLCNIDPEGDYGTLDELVTLGTQQRAPHLDEVLTVLTDPTANLVINLLGIPLADRPDFFSQLLPRLQGQRARTGRPHWIVIDEVHHLIPASWGQAGSTLPQRLGESILITFRPSEVAPCLLARIDTVVAVGPHPEEAIAELATALDVPSPDVPTFSAERDEVVIWQRSAGAEPIRARTLPPRAERLRHLRKYAEGNLGSRGFLFRGSRGQLRLRAVNLMSFCELADGVDEDTWLFHLRAGDYSNWIRRRIKDDGLADEIAEIERDEHASAAASVRLVREAIERRYMLPR